MHEITPLRKEFDGRGEVKGFQFKQRCKTLKAYIYEVRHPETQRVYYEVFKRKVFAPDDREIYPRSGSFGKWAWTSNSYDEAFKKMVELS
jgi:hypothetical protein